MLGVYWLCIEIKLYFFESIAVNNRIPVSTKYLTNTVFNFAFAFLFFRLIKLLNVEKLSGFSTGKIKRWKVLIFPLYLVVIYEILYPSIPFLSNVKVQNWLLLISWVVSVSFVEEFLFRGFLQSIFIKKFTHNKTTLIYSILGASMVFGLSHLITYDLGFYLELAQVLYAFFLAFLFGAFIVITRKIWPSIVLHALVDIPAVLDVFSSEYSFLRPNFYDSTSIQDFLEPTLIILPCFLYGMYLLLKLKDEEVQEILSLKE